MVPGRPGSAAVAGPVGGSTAGQCVPGFGSSPVNMYRLAASMTHGLFLNYVPWSQPS